MRNLKTFEELNSDIDPYGEENWREFEQIPLYLSEDQEKVYRDGTPLQKPWTRKNLVLFEKNDKYYVLGEIRYGNPESGFFMFYEDNDNIEREHLKEFKGEVLRELNKEERIKVMDILSRGRKFTMNIMNSENGRSYIDILNTLI